MPRKPARRCQVLKWKPLSFSPFVRTVARVASASKVKHKTQDSAENGFKHDLKGKKNKQQSESSEEEDFERVVQADFAFFDPKPNDFHGVKILLQSYLDDKVWDLSGFVDVILAQTTVGTVVKIEDSEDDGLFSLVTALNFGRYKDNKCFMELKQFLHNICREKDLAGEFKSLLEEQAHSVGLLVSQRVMNLPLQLLPPLYDALFDEISWATEDEPTEELRQSFCFKFYLLVSNIYKHKNADRQRGPSKDNDEAIIYIKPEDEIFHKLSWWSFSFPLHAQQVTTRELRNYQRMGLVMVVEAEKIFTFRQQLKSLVDDS